MTPSGRFHRERRFEDPMGSASLTIDAGVGTILLNRPEQGNALDMTLALELRDLAARVANDGLVRCVVLTGAGRMFCSGGDINAFTRASDRGAFVTELASVVHGAILSLLTMEKPLLVLVNGPAAGAGLSLASIGDVVLAARSAHFSAAYTRLGVTPDGGLTWLLPRLIGLRRAQEMIIANRCLSADEAESLGLVSRCVADDQLVSEGRAMAAELVQASTAAIGACRSLLLQGATAELAEQLAEEAVMIDANASRPDGLEGVSAFLERRRPRFVTVPGQANSKDRSGER